VYTSLGPIALATQSVLLVSASTAWQAPFALSIAASVRFVLSYLSVVFLRIFSAVLVTSLGSGRRDVPVSQHIHRSSYLWRYRPCGGAILPQISYIFTYLYNPLPSTLFLVFKDSWARLFNDDSGTLSLCRPLRPGFHISVYQRSLRWSRLSFRLLHYFKFLMARLVSPMAFSEHEGNKSVNEEMHFRGF
jgi:hypothetical protein